MSTNNKIRLGLIGAGNIGKVHLDNFSKFSEYCAIVAITDAYLPVAEARAKEYNIPNVSNNADELIDRSDIDAVIIGVPNQFHAPLAIQALEAGKHVLLEKPMAIHVGAAKEILMAQRKTGKIVMVGHQMRFEWAPQQVKAQVQRGELGRIYAAKTGWYRRKGIPGWGTWFTQKSQSGGGPLIDIGVHMLDLALYLMGNPKPVSVFGTTYAEFGPKRKGIGTWGTPNWDGIYDVEDLAMAYIKMEDGSSLLLEVSWAVHMDTENEPFLHLMGTEGGASLIGKKGGFKAGKFLTERFDRPMDINFEEPEYDEGGRYRLTKHFLECVRDGNEPITSVMSGYTNNLILEAIYKSSRTGNEVKLDWSL